MGKYVFTINLSLEIDLSATAFTDAVFGQSGGSFGIYSGGTDLWGGTNQFSSIYLKGGLRSKATVTTQVVSRYPTRPWARAGIIVRNDLSSHSSAGFITLAVTPQNGCVLSWDTDGDGQLDNLAIAARFAAPVYLRLTRAGEGITGACSTNGTTRLDSYSSGPIIGE